MLLSKANEETEYASQMDEMLYVRLGVDVKQKY